MIATAKELRFHAKELLDAVSRGEEVVITFRGKPHAKLVPIEPSQTLITTSNKLFGMWKDYATVEDIEKYIREKRKGRF